MKLYLVTRTDHVRYDEYGAAVVAARTEEEAIALAPWTPTEAHDKRPTVQLVGLAVPEVAPGVVLGAFNAG